MENSTKYRKIALSFAQLLKDSLSPGEWESLIRENEEYKYTNCCASHNYLDANIVMDEAIKKHVSHFNIHHTPHTKMWNEAWDYAVQKNFFVT
jgi:hypothetical protein